MGMNKGLDKLVRLVFCASCGGETLVVVVVEFATILSCCGMPINTTAQSKLKDQ
jgi:hypothetical protein